MRKWINILSTTLQLGSLICVFLVMLSAAVISAYTCIRITAQNDRSYEALVDAIAKLDGYMLRLDAHAENLVKKSNQINNKLDKQKSRHGG